MTWTPQGVEMYERVCTFLASHPNPLDVSRCVTMSVGFSPASVAIRLELLLCDEHIAQARAFAEHPACESLELVESTNVMPHFVLRLLFEGPQASDLWGILTMPLSQLVEVRRHG